MIQYKSCEPKIKHKEQKLEFIYKKNDIIQHDKYKNFDFNFADNIELDDSDMLADLKHVLKKEFKKESKEIKRIKKELNKVRRPL